VSSALLSVDGEPSDTKEICYKTTRSRKTNPTREDVQLCYDFVIDTVLSLQEQDARVRGVVTRRMRLMNR
jgi:hypothetical protein